jgi:methylmalonyl-CoA mutase N-terminal domain/subunit
MTGRDAREELRRRRAREGAEARSLAEVRAASAALQDARSLDDENLMRMAARRAARVDPELLPGRWAVWVREVRAMLGEAQ